MSNFPYNYSRFFQRLYWHPWEETHPKCHFIYLLIHLFVLIHFYWNKIASLSPPPFPSSAPPRYPLFKPHVFPPLPFFLLHALYILCRHVHTYLDTACSFWQGDCVSVVSQLTIYTTAPTWKVQWTSQKRGRKTVRDRKPEVFCEASPPQNGGINRIGRRVLSCCRGRDTSQSRTPTQRTIGS